MRPSVEQLLNAAVSALNLAGPLATVGSPTTSDGLSSWVGRNFAEALTLDCRVPADVAADGEIALDRLPFEDGSVRTLLCVDLLRRYEETSRFLRLALPLLAPGGTVILTADIGAARPQAGLSRVLTPLGLERLCSGLDAAVVGWQGDVDFPTSVFLVACRSPVSNRFARSVGCFIEAFQENQRAAAQPGPWPIRLWRVVTGRPATGPMDPVGGNAASFSLHLPHGADWRGMLLNPPDSTGARLDLC